MTFEEFERATPDQLRLYAKSRFEAAQVGVAPLMARSTYLWDAMFYMQEIDRRNDSRIARRDFRMELIVIALIALELAAGAWGIWLATKESREQAQTMERVVQGLERVEKAALAARNAIIVK